MTYQSQSNSYVAFKKQSGLGSQASGSGATVLRISGGQGGRLTKAATASAEVRRDGQRTRGRHGTQKTAGPYNMEWSLGCADPILAGIMRGPWGTADLELDSGDFTSITVEADGVVFSSGSPITLGLRVGQVFRLEESDEPENNDRNLRIAGLSATKITTKETLTVNASADTGVKVVRPGRVLSNPPAGSLLKEYFTIEEHEVDIDGSEIFDDCFFGSGAFRMGPNGIIMFDPSWTGTGKFQTKAGGDAPHFTSPATPTGIPMAVVDATISIGGTDVVDLTAFDLTFGTGPTAPDVFGSGAQKYAPDVFPGNMAVGINFTALRSDLSRVNALLNEEQLSLHVLAVDNESEPKDFLSIYVPNFTLGGVDKSATSNEAGPRTQTIAVPNELVGKDERGGAYEPTTIMFQVSNAT